MHSCGMIIQKIQTGGPIFLDKLWLLQVRMKRCLTYSRFLCRFLDSPAGDQIRY
jgi:hypothetical protein